MSTKHPDSDDASKEGPPDQPTPDSREDQPEAPLLSRLRGALDGPERVEPEAHKEWLAVKHGL